MSAGRAALFVSVLIGAVFMVNAPAVLAADCNGNGIEDACDIDQTSTAPGGPFYCDPMFGQCDEDCNNNAVPDVCDGSLVIQSSPQTLPYLWVACTNRDTVVRIATSNYDPITGRTGVTPGDVLGE